MISSLLQLGELGLRLEDYLGQRWLFSSPLSPYSTRSHSGQNYNRNHYLIFSALLSLASLFPLLAVAVIFSNSDIKIKSNLKVKKVATCHPFSASFYLLCSCFSETRRKSAISAERPVRHLLWRHRHLNRAEQQGLAYKRENDSSTALRPQKRCHSWPHWTTFCHFGPKVWSQNFVSNF